MRIFVIGATGHTGTQIVDLALSRGHEVTAFVRSPHKIGRQDKRLKVLAGDPHNVEQLTSALPRHDVVLSALGVRPPQFFAEEQPRLLLIPSRPRRFAVPSP
jgi:putative NADH-flavin reductase